MAQDDADQAGMDDAEATPILPAHIEETVQAIARLHAEHHRRASPLQRAVDRLTRMIGQPQFLGVLSSIVIAWVVMNLAMKLAGLRAFDAPPFNWLQGAVGLLALYVTTLILTTQRREDELAGYREQLTLELAILSEQKSAKIIALLEEMRTDHPLLRDRVDHEAAAMAKPADPQAVLDALKNSHEIAAAEGLIEEPGTGSLSLQAGAGV